MRKSRSWLVFLTWSAFIIGSIAFAQAPSPAKEKAQAHTDRYGDPLPTGAVARLGTMRLRPGYRVFCLPDGKRFLSLAFEGEKWVVCVWRMSTGELLLRFEVPPCSDGAALSPDGKTLALNQVDRDGRQSHILLWDVASGRMIRELDGIRGFVRALAFAPDGKTLATAGKDWTLRLWDWRTATELRRCQGVRDQWSFLAFSPDGKILASVSLTQKFVQLWDAASGRALRKLGEKTGRLEIPAFAPDGKTLAAIDLDQKVIRLWDVSTGNEVRQLPGEWRTEALAFSPDGKTLAVGGMSEAEDGKRVIRPIPRPIHLWEVSTGREVRQLSGHLFKVTSLAFSPDGQKLVSAGSFLTLHVWDVATGKDVLPFAEHESYVESVAFSPDGLLLASAGLDGTIRLWDPKSGRLARLLQGENPTVIRHLAFAPDGRGLAASEADGSLRLWDVATGKPTRRVRMSAGEDYHDLSFVYAPDGRSLAVRHPDGTVRLLDPTTGDEKRRLKAAAKEGMGLCFSPDGGKLAAMSWVPGGKGVLQVWETTTGTESRRWPISNRGSFPIVFSPDGQTVTGGTNDFPLRPDQVRAVHLHLWDVATGEESTIAGPVQGLVFCMALSPDGHMLAWGDHVGTVTLWERATHQVRRRLKGQYSHIRSLAFSPDGATLASGSTDTTVLLWDATGRPAAPPPGTLSAEGLQTLWDDLAGKDAARAFDAIGLLTAVSERAVPMLREKLKPAPAPADRKHVARLVADLDSDQFAVREKAMKELRQLGERAEAELRSALKGKLTPEALKRVKELLENVRASAIVAERLRDLRAVEILEHIGTPDARRVLRTLAHGAPAARLTREAKAALDRLAHSPRLAGES